jgi:hypothetical protein
MGPLLREEPERSDLGRVLSVSRSRVFKIWRLDNRLRVAGLLLLVVAALAGGWALWVFRDRSLLDVGVVFWAVASLVVGIVVGKTVLRVLRWRTTLRDTLARIGFGIAMGLGGFLIARLHLAVFDRWYLRRGRVERVARDDHV